MVRNKMQVDSNPEIVIMGLNLPAFYYQNVLNVVVILLKK